MRHLLTLLFVVAAPLVAQAEDAVPAAANGPAATEPVKFLPIDRSGRPSSLKFQAAPHTAAAPVRTDSSAMNGGFMRIDRAITTPSYSQHALVVKPQGISSSADTPRVIRGTQAEAPSASATPATIINSNDPVLSLFNEGDSGKPASFRDALLGRPGSPATRALNAPVPMASLAGNFVWPIPAASTQKISSGFGYRADPIDHHTEFHNGIDIAAAPGTPVLSSSDGQVAKVGVDGLFGQSITVLNRDGSESKYGHLSAQNVVAGQQVKAGQTIGAVGATGRVTGPHLDYRISQNGVNLDPLKILPAPTNVAIDNHTPVHNSTPIVTSIKPMQTAKQERLIIVR